MNDKLDVLGFWFEEIEPQKWWVSDSEFDREVISRFSETHIRAHHGKLHEWRSSADGRLAEIIVLDQFSRNMFRGSARAFESDALALELAKEAIAVGADQALMRTHRSFLYMPFMHSESPDTHTIAVDLFTQLGDQRNLNFELKHKAIIDRFGRYPHRNEQLGRESTEEELEFLKQPGSEF